MFEDKEEKGREEIIDYALKLSRAGLNVNSSGNLSVRFDSPEGKGFLITPTGLPYDETEPEDLVRILFMDNGCYKAVGSRQPSSEWNLHAFLYQARPDINAVVHTHSPYATMLSCLTRQFLRSITWLQLWEAIRFPAHLCYVRLRGLGRRLSRYAGQRSLGVPPFASRQRGSGP